MIIDKYNENLENEILNFIILRFGYEFFNPGLERTKVLYSELIRTLANGRVKTITISGTNGKGQTAHTLIHLLNQKKQNVALWTSPHILSIRERYCFSQNGLIADIHYEELRSSIVTAIEFIDREFPSLKISFYEFLFYVFLKLCAQRVHELDYMILEVGVGGRFDAVNHIDADLTCITSISRDHQELLGNRYELILEEKLGITRSGVPLYTNFKLAYLNQAVAKFCLQFNIPWISLAKNQDCSYFEENKNMSLALANYFFPNEKFDTGKLPNFKGRFETITKGQTTFTFNGAHNTDGVRKLSSMLAEQNGQDKFDEIWVSFSKRDVKEIKYMLKILLQAQKNKSKIILTTYSHPKAMDKTCIKIIFDKLIQESIGTLEFVENWEISIVKGNNQRVLVCGSYYFIGEVQKFLSHIPH